LDEAHQAAVLEGNVTPRRTCTASGDCLAGRWRGDARFAGAPGIFCVCGLRLSLAKRELIEGLNGHASTAVLNADDRVLQAFGAFAPGRVLTTASKSRLFSWRKICEDRGALGSAFDM